MASTTPSPTSLLCVERAAAWFQRSGIQEPNGGVARYYRIDQQRNAPVSTEITGYAVSTWVYLYKQTLEAAHLQAAQRAADFLCGTAWSSELDTMPFEAAPAPAYFFDLGIIARGLLSLYRVTRRPELLRVAEGCARSMARDFAIGDGRYHPVIELPGKEARPHGPRWSQGPGCYQLKSGMAWLELYEETGKVEYAELYRAMLRQSLRDEATFLPGASDPHDVMDRLHPYCYFLEAVLPALEQGDLRDVAAAGIRRTGKLLRAIQNDFVRADAYGQLLRVRLLAAAYGAVPLDVAAAAEEAAAMERHQIVSSDRRLDGGFYFGFRHGAVSPFANPVTTAFCLQALDAYEQFRAGRLTLTRQTLI